MANTAERVASALQGLAHALSTGKDGVVVVQVALQDAKECVLRLRDRAQFETNTFVTAVDRFPAAPRFECTWQFMSVQHADRVRVCAPVEGGEPKAPSIVDLYPGAAYAERECFDMFGIVFEGHAGLKRLLMPEEYDHFPLRKDFPHHGIEPDRLYREWDRRRRERAAVSDHSEIADQ